MVKESVLKIKDFTVLDIAVSSDEGDKINMIINEFLSRSENVILDFQGISIITTAFLNAAIGQLYKDYSSEELAKRLSLCNVKDIDLPLFKKVTDRAKEYFRNTDSFSNTTDDVLNGQS